MHPDAVLSVLGNAFDQGVSQPLRAWQQQHICALRLWPICAIASLLLCACALLLDALALLLLAASHLFCHLAASHLRAMAYGHSSGLPPYKAPVMIAEKHKLFFLFSLSSVLP